MNNAASSYFHIRKMFVCFLPMPPLFLFINTVHTDPHTQMERQSGGWHRDVKSRFGNRVTVGTGGSVSGQMKSNSKPIHPSSGENNVPRSAFAPDQQQYWQSSLGVEHSSGAHGSRSATVIRTLVQMRVGVVPRERYDLT